MAHVKVACYRLHFFARYIREALNEIMASGVGCHIGDVCFNVLAYADDLVLLAPSWAAMQQLLNVFHSSCLLYTSPSPRD